MTQDSSSEHSDPGTTKPEDHPPTAVEEVIKSEEKSEDEKSAFDISKIKELLASKPFRYLLIGDLINQTGDALYFIALPWLALSISDSGALIGGLLLAASLPRALGMVFGGALVDHLGDSRVVMLFTSAFKGVLTLVLAILLLVVKTARPLDLYVISVLFGLSDSVYFPAHLSIIPQILREQMHLLEVANAVISMSAMIALSLGPIISGIVISQFPSEIIDPDSGEPIPSLQGVGWAIAIDVVTFLLHMGFMVLIGVAIRESQVVTAEEWAAQIDREPSESEVVLDPTPAPTPSAEQAKAGEKMSLRDTLRFIRSVRPMVVLFVVMGVENVVFSGPFFVSLPVRIKQEMGEDAKTFGRVITFYGLFTLIGGAWVAIGNQIRHTYLFLGLISMSLCYGLSLICYGLLGPWLMVVNSIIIGGLDGFWMPLIQAWLQRRAPPSRTGTIMGLFMFTLMGLEPISYALAGLLVSQGAGKLMVRAGLFLCCSFVIFIIWGFGFRWVFEKEEDGVAEVSAATV
eukprot:gnl/Dysnectes_brevis/1020_a1137_1823.p1 GENE.gnl/Dysnectes_brevis/1020_a1137_1823~~gnl/Dysnectes_brevis/1020_a1137_1823.p1  ORF type:complete len:516 (-),score=207.78 gnl/Dysnectes_brevis/1020_a1137_1823:1451-2998(-)